jgi:hypothetical protein
MHTNVHFAIGVIIGSLTSIWVPVNFWTFGIIIFCAIAPDFDIVFVKRARDTNHRNLFTHSIYLMLSLLILALIFWSGWILAAALAYLSHLCIDCLDWGLDMFHNGKTFGVTWLKNGHDAEIQESLTKPPSLRKGFFIVRYYSSVWVLILEVLLCIGMVVSFIYLLPQFWYFGLAYPVALGFHLLEYYDFRLAEKGKKLPINLPNH